MLPGEGQPDTGPFFTALENLGENRREFRQELVRNTWDIFI